MRNECPSEEILLAFHLGTLSETEVEAVAEHLAGMNVPFLRRLHPDPDPGKMQRFKRDADVLRADRLGA